MSESSTRPPASSASDVGTGADGGGTRAGLGHRLAVVAAVAAAVVALDQATKEWALAALDDGPVELVWTLRLNLTFNDGAAFSLGDRGGLIALVGLVVLAVVFRAALRWPSPWAPVALGAVLGGALGNLADRAFRAGDDGPLGGHVVDFVDLQWWPVFNVADMAVSVGAVLLVLLSWRTEHSDGSAGG